MADDPLSFRLVPRSVIWLVISRVPLWGFWRGVVPLVVVSDRIEFLNRLLGKPCSQVLSEPLGRSTSDGLVVVVFR